MKILFSMRHSGALRNFASTIEELARRGHRIHLVFMTHDKLGDTRLLRQLTGSYPGVTASAPPEKQAPSPWLGLARRVRSIRDYARYRAPEYARATALHDRAERYVSPGVRRLMRLPAVRTRAGLTLLPRLLRQIEQAIPPDPAVLAIVSREAPDLVLVTPLIDLASDQIEYVKAAQSLGVPSGLCVHSWDNLTNKGIIHVLPSRVFVWNEAQRREAVTLHGVPEADVVVTGAPCYDQWFSRRPGTTRAEFCRKVGLSLDKPYFLYLCSSQFIAPHEGDFVKRWIQAVRSSSDPRVRDAGILVRPHPRNDMSRWKRFDPSAFSNVAIWPAEGANPVDAESRNDYFDSIYHSAAAVGVNTSAQIEAGIVGRDVYSIRVPEYQQTQEGTLHFHHLLNEGGGLLLLADTLEEHVHALSSALDRTAESEQRLRSFVERFVRPNGLSTAATPLLADAIERLSEAPVTAPAGDRMWARVARRALYPLAVRIRSERPVVKRRPAPDARAPERIEKTTGLVH